MDGDVLHWLQESLCRADIPFVDQSEDYPTTEHEYKEAMLHTGVGSKSFVSGRYMDWPAADSALVHPPAPTAVRALARSLRLINRPVIEKILEESEAGPLLSWENAFAVVAVQHHEGHHGVQYGTSNHGTHRDFMWRAVTAVVTLQGKRTVHFGKDAIHCQEGSTYMACPFDPHSVQFPATFCSTSALFSFGVPAAVWESMALPAAKALYDRLRQA